jgi:hypothetical protein
MFEVLSRAGSFVQSFFDETSKIIATQMKLSLDECQVLAQHYTIKAKSVPLRTNRMSPVIICFLA